MTLFEMKDTLKANIAQGMDAIWLDEYGNEARPQQHVTHTAPNGCWLDNRPMRWVYLAHAANNGRLKFYHAGEPVSFQTDAETKPIQP